MNKALQLIKAAIAVVIIFISVMNITGCNRYEPKKEEKSTEIVEKSPKEEQKLIAFAHKSINSYFYIIIHESIKRAAQERNWKFESSVADYDPVKQNNQFINFIAKKPSAIISDSINSESLTDAIFKANENGIPVGIIDTPSTGGDVAVTVAFDNYLAGKMAAQEIVKRLIKKYGSAKGTVFNAYGEETSLAWRLRKEGFEDEIGKYPRIKYIARPGEGDYGKVRDALMSVIQQGYDIDAVHCSSDQPGRGMVEALQKNNMWKKVWEPGHVIFVTIDGEPVSVQNIRERYYDACIVQDAISYGTIAVELLEKYTFNGKRLEPGLYKSDKFLWFEAQIKESPSGPYVVIPPYVMDVLNYSDPRHWANISTDYWGFEYK